MAGELPWSCPGTATAEEEEESGRKADYIMAPVILVASPTPVFSSGFERGLGKLRPLSAGASKLDEQISESSKGGKQRSRLVVCRPVAAVFFECVASFPAMFPEGIHILP